jgi:iron complex outermembrane recepter protein
VRSIIHALVMPRAKAVNMSTGRPRHRVRASWQVSSALAILTLVPATVLAQGPASEPPLAPADDTALPPAAPADTAWTPAPTWAPPPPPAPLLAPAPPPAPAPAWTPAPAPAWTPAPAPAWTPAPPAALAVEPAATAATTSMDARAATLDATSPVPMTVLDRAMLESTGTASLGQALQQLSWQSNALNTQFNNGGDGSTRIALRGLGATRTLILVNGRRHVHGGTGADASVDLEAIPLAMVERVEIVRGPAGLHGLGGMAGVINIVTRQDVDGVQAAAFTGGTPGGVGQTYDASVTLGQRFERGRVTASAGFHQQQSVLGTDREFGQSDLLYDWTTGEIIELGSTAVPEGYIRDHGEAPGNQAWQDLVARSGGATSFFNDPAEGWRPFRGTGNSDSGAGDYYNYAPENYLVTPLSRYHVSASGDYQLGDQLRAFAEASYVNRQSEQQLAAEPLFTATEGITVSAGNIYNPFGRDFIDMRRRVVEAGNRRSQQDIDTMRLVVGVDGALPLALGTPESWRWEASYGYGVADSTETARGNLRPDRLAPALGPSFIDATGTPRCGTVGDPIDGCVPLNLFGGAGSITPTMLGYVGHTGVREGRNEQHRVAVEAGGDLMRTSSGARVSLAFGADYREESGSVTEDPVDTTGSQRISFDGSYEVRGAHASLTAIPFVDQAAGRGLELQAGANTFDLSTSGSGASWHVAGIARLGGGLGVRASQGRGMGAPSLAALFSEGVEGFPVVSDPCSNPSTPNVAANCSADGVPGDFFDDRTQLRTLSGGGSPKLRPEIADVRSAGVVLAPDFAPGLALSADYFEISVDDEINRIGADAILQSCYGSDPGARSLCDRVIRDPATNLIEIIVDSQSNRGSRETAGVDVQISHDDVTSIGRLRYRVGGTWLRKFEVVSPDGTTRVGKGVYDLGVHPEYRLDGSLLWDNGLIGAGAHVRYVGGFRECEGNDCMLGLNPDGSSRLPEDGSDRPITRFVEGYLTADVLGSLTLATALGQTMVTVGVRNVLDSQPPAVYNGFTASSDVSTYDYTGRFAYLRLTQQF